MQTTQSRRFPKSVISETKTNILVLSSWPKVWSLAQYTVIIAKVTGHLVVGPDDAQQKIEPHHTAVLGEGDFVQVENKVF